MYKLFSRKDIYLRSLQPLSSNDDDLEIEPDHLTVNVSSNNSETNAISRVALGDSSVEETNTTSRVPLSDISIEETNTILREALYEEPQQIENSDVFQPNSLQEIIGDRRRQNQHF